MNNIIQFKIKKYKEEGIALENLEHLIEDDGFKSFIIIGKKDMPDNKQEIVVSMHAININQAIGILERAKLIIIDDDGEE